MASASGKISSDKLIDLKVVDLRSELEKRGLNKTGVKAVLLERLEKALKNEGESLGNTEEIEEKSDTVPSSPPEQSSSSAETNTKEENSEISSSAENTTKEKNSEISSSTENTTKEEKSEKSSVSENTVEEEKSEQSSSASIKIERKDEEVAKTVLSDSLPPTPTSVPCIAPFTLTDTISMDTSTTQQSEENESLIVHVDDTQNDLDTDLVASKTNKAKTDTVKTDTVKTDKVKTDKVKTDKVKTDKVKTDKVKTDKVKTDKVKTDKVKTDKVKTDKVKTDKVKTKKAKKDKTSKEKVSGKSKVKKTDGSKVEEGSKDTTEGGQTEKKADEKKVVKSNRYTYFESDLEKNYTCLQLKRLRMLVTGFPLKTVVKDLTTLFSKHGTMSWFCNYVYNPTEVAECVEHLNQTELLGDTITIKMVVGASIFVYAHGCEGSVTMSTLTEVTECIKHLNKTELLGDTITITTLKQRIQFRKSLKADKLAQRRRFKKFGLAYLLLQGADPREKMKALKMDNANEKRRLNRLKLKNNKILKFKQEKERIIKERLNIEARCVGLLRKKLEDMKRSMKREFEQNLRNETKRFENESRFNEYGHTDYERRGERSERRESRAFEGGSRFDERNEREMMRREMGPVQDIRVGDERRTDDREMMRREMGPVRDIRVGDERRTDDREMMRREMGPVRDIRVGDERRTDDREMMRREMGPVRDIRVGDERRTDDREMMRREMGPVHDIQVRDVRRTDDWPRPEEKLGHFNSRMPYEFRGDMEVSREPERKFIGPDQGRDTDRQNISAQDRLSMARNSLVGGPDQRPSWGSDSISRKVDSWSHMQGDMDNSGMNRPNDQWPKNLMNTTGRGAFVGNPRPGNGGGMVQNMGYTNMFGNTQSQGGNWQPSATGWGTHGSGGGGGGGGNMSGHLQVPHFDAYNAMGSMQNANKNFATGSGWESRQGADGI